ncbi:MAG: tetratricopeptide repeat protein [Thermodesulfobacteriota bacterium]
MALFETNTRHSSNSRVACLPSGRFYAVITIILISFTSYWNALSNDFVWDDTALIVENKAIRSLSITQLGEFFTGSEVYNTAKGEVYRPLYVLSYAIDYKFFELEPIGYHVINVTLHALNSVMVFLVASLFFNRLEDKKQEAIYYSPALMAALIFATHPIHTESVAWVKGRDDLLAMFFMLSAFYLWIKSTLNSRPSTLNYLLSLLFYTLALLSKEMAITLPLILILYDYLLKDRSKVKGKNLIDLWRHIPYWIVTFLYLGIRTLILNQVAQQGGYLGGGFSPAMYTMTKGIAYYIKLLIMPINLSADYLTFPISRTMDWQVILSLSILLAILVAAMVSYRYSRMVTFGILWFFITILPVSNIIPLRIAIAERFLYIPSIGFCLLLGAGLKWGLETWPAVKRPVFVLFIAIIVLYSSGTIARNRVWRNEYVLWSDVVRRYPNNERAHANLGLVYEERGLLTEAEAELKNAIKIRKDFVNAHNSLGIVYHKKKSFDLALKELQTAIELDPTHVKAHYNLGLVYRDLKRYPDALRAFQSAIELKPDYSEGYNNIGNIYLIQGHVEKAIDEYRNALRFDSDNIEVYYNIASSLEQIGRIEEAIENYSIFVERASPEYISVVEEVKMRMERLK